MQTTFKLGTSNTLIVCAAFLLAAGGCHTSDDNPNTPEKMQEIRQKESQGRQSFNPSMAPPAKK
jgi:hypothetical protein